jgi:hypothetical protein
MSKFGKSLPSNRSHKPCYEYMQVSAMREIRLLRLMWREQEIEHDMATKALPIERGSQRLCSI